MNFKTALELAAEKAYEDNYDYIVGQDKNGDWRAAHYEDDGGQAAMIHKFLCGSSGFKARVFVYGNNVDTFLISNAGLYIFTDSGDIDEIESIPEDAIYCSPGIAYEWYNKIPESML